MKYEKLFEHLKQYYFNNYTYVGVSGSGNFKRQMTKNTVVFILAICLMLTVYVPWEKLLGIVQYCSVLISLIGVIFSILLYGYHSFRIQSKVNKNPQSINLLKDPKKISILLEEYLNKYDADVSTYLIDRLIFYCNRRIEVLKQAAIIVLSLFIILLSAVIGIFLGPLLIEILGSDVDGPKLTLEENIQYLGLSLLFLIVVSHLQYQFTLGRLGSLYQYQQFNNSLEELKYYIYQREEDLKRKELAKELLTQMENENVSKKGWLRKLVDQFLK